MGGRGPALLLLVDNVAGGVTHLPRLAGTIESSGRVELSKDLWTDKACNGYKSPGQYMATLASAGIGIQLLRQGKCQELIREESSPPYHPNYNEINLS